MNFFSCWGVNIKFFYTNLRNTTETEKKNWEQLYPKLGPEGRFCLNVAAFFGKNSFIARQGSWKSPWPVEVLPAFAMPTYDPDFTTDFTTVSDLRAKDIAGLIRQKDARVTLYYSGGIDSTVCLVSLLRNLSPDELKMIDIAMSSESLIENPYFFEKYISGKFRIVNSASVRLSDLKTSGQYAISCELGDSIFGTELGLNLLHSYDELLAKLPQATRTRLAGLHGKVGDAGTHFSEYADLLIAFYQIERDPQFGRLYFERIQAQIKSAEQPVLSLHDFFWWEIFNLKYVECALRSSLYYYAGHDRARAVNEQIINWYNNDNYQKWSMKNNNNGQKFDGASALGYKWAAKKYIYEFDKNPWYFRYKTKLPSLKSILYRNEALLNEDSIFAMDTDYRLHYYNDPQVRLLIEQGLLEIDL